MLAYLRDMYAQASQGGSIDHHDRVPRGTMRTVLHESLQQSSPENTRLLLSRFDATAGPTVSFEDLCRVFVSLAGDGVDVEDDDDVIYGNRFKDGSALLASDVSADDSTIGLSHIGGGGGGGLDASVLSNMQDELDKSRTEVSDLQNALSRLKEEKARTALRIEEEVSECMHACQMCISSA